jgi:hypothetical protein
MDLQEVVVQLLALKFNEPERDGLLIRQHAYLTGKKDVIETMMRDSYPDPELPLTEEQKQQQLADSLSNQTGEI